MYASQETSITFLDIVDLGAIQRVNSCGIKSLEGMLPEVSLVGIADQTELNLSALSPSQIRRIQATIASVCMLVEDLNDYFACVVDTTFWDTRLYQFADELKALLQELDCRVRVDGVVDIDGDMASVVFPPREEPDNFDLTAGEDDLCVIATKSSLKTRTYVSLKALREHLSESFVAVNARAA